MPYLYVVTPDKEFLLFKGKVNKNKFTFTHPLTKRKVTVNVWDEPGIIFNDRVWFEQKSDKKANETFMNRPFNYIHREILSQKDIPKNAVVFYKCNKTKCKNCTADQGLCTNTINVRFASTPEIFRQFVYDFAFDHYRQIETNTTQAFKFKVEV